MLILSRKSGEKIVIRVPASAEETVIEVLVSRISHGSENSAAKLGITAPRSVSVDREEIADLKAREAEAAEGQWLDSLRI